LRPDSTILNSINNVLENIKCNGEIQLYDQTAYDHSETFFIPMFILAMITFVIIEILVLRFCYKQITSEMKINVLYAITIFVGTALNGVSIVYFFKIPYEDSVCLTRALLITSGYSLLYCAITFRTAQIYELYREAILVDTDIRSNSKKLCSIMLFEKDNRGPLKLYIITLFTLLIAQVTILTTWMNYDSYTSHYFAINTRRFVYAYTCNSNYLPYWIAIEIALFVIINLIIIRLLYYTFEKQVEKHKDLKWILLSMNNLILGFIIVIPLTNIIQNDNDVYAIYSITISFTTIGTVLALVFSPITIPCFNCIKITAKNEYNLISSDDTGSLNRQSTNINFNE